MNPIPPVPGPKIAPFRYKDWPLNIKFLEPLGDGKDGHVWKISIDTIVYALKVFPYERLEEYWDENGGDTKKYYYDSFYRECRAYGRLNEVEMDHRVAKCYGYVLLTPHQEDHLRGEGVPIKKRRHENPHSPIQALVKEFVDSGISFTPRMVPRMIRDLQEINKVGIMIFDVRQENYLDGRLLEFGSSKTVPHPRLNEEIVDYFVKRNAGLENLPKADEDDFDQMIDDYNEETTGPRIWKRIGPNWDLKENVLRKTRLDVYKHEAYYPKYRPELYDWEKAERDREAKRQKQVHSSKSDVKNMKYVDI